MRFDITEEESKKAKIPHEIFLTNLIGNHILWFVASLGLVKTYWQPLAFVPLFSLGSLAYVLWRAKKAKESESWFVMCHWQIGAKRSRMFIYMLLLLLVVSLFGWIGYTYLGMMKVAVMAMIGGMGILPVMVTVLVLIIMESDALYQAVQRRLPKGILEQYPNPGIAVIDDQYKHDDE